MVRRDEDDLGALFIFDLDGRYIDTAVNAGRSGFSDEAFAREARRDQQVFMTAARKELRGKVRDFSFEDARDRLLRRDAEAAGKLTTLPVPTRERTTTMLESTRALPAAPDSIHLPEATRQLASPMRRALTVPERIAETDRILAAHGTGQEVDADDLKAARLFASSAEYRADKLIQADFAARRAPQSITENTARENRL